MSSIEQALVAEILAESTITAIIADRIYPLLIPQDVTLPAIAYQVISGPVSYHHDGPDRYTIKRIQLTCQAQTYAAVKALVDAIKAHLSGYVGNLGSLSNVRGLFFDSEIDGRGLLYAPPEDTVKTVRLDITPQYYDD